MINNLINSLTEYQTYKTSKHHKKYNNFPSILA